jgi:hypothetical protein
MREALNSALSREILHVMNTRRVSEIGRPMAKRVVGGESGEARRNTSNKK